MSTPPPSPSPPRAIPIFPVHVKHEDSDICLHQMTASAVGNIPEGNIDSAKEMIVRHAMHADQMLFDFKVALLKACPLFFDWCPLASCSALL